MLLALALYCLNVVCMSVYVRAGPSGQRHATARFGEVKWRGKNCAHKMIVVFVSQLKK